MLGAVVYGPVGGAHCLLKWCFTGPTVITALSHTHTHTHSAQSLWEREGRLEETVSKTREGRRGGERAGDNVWMCGSTCLLHLAGIGFFCILEHNKFVWKEKHETPRPLNLAITSHIVLKLLKRGCVWRYIDFKACSGFPAVDFGTACLC